MNFRNANKLALAGYMFCATILGQTISQSAQAAATDTAWSSWLNQEIEQHPDIIAAKEARNAAYSFAEGRGKALYNPEFDSEFEKDGSDKNYLLGISQTIDWTGKRDLRQQQAEFDRNQAQQSYNLTRQMKSEEALQVLIEWHAANDQASLALRQEEQLDTLLEVIEGRLQAGDLGQIDAELTFLSLSQKLNETAKAQVRLKQIKAKMGEILPTWTSTRGAIPLNFWSSNTLTNADRGQLQALVSSHPQVLAAQAKWNAMRQLAGLAEKGTKADPTIGVSAGRSADENVVTLNFSIPLNIRNNFNAEARAANQEALAAEAEYLSLRRKQIAAIKASYATTKEFKQRFDRWQKLMAGRGESSSNLLEIQWQSGDLSTTEYLLALQQRTEGLIAGIELRTQYQTAHVAWLLETGRIATALK